MMFDWDDVRVFIATAQTGTLGAAGAKLGMDPATVGRRVARLESALKSTLLIRSVSGVQLTAMGAQLLRQALEAETAMGAVAELAQPDVTAGVVRISASEGFGAAILAPALPALKAMRPNLTIELAASPGFLSPSRREVDMAITLSPPDGSRLIVEPLTSYQLALFASPDYLKTRDQPDTIEDLSEHAIIGYVDDLIYAPELRYLDEVRPGLTPGLASSSIQAQKLIIANGGGIGVLPCFLAAGLTRVLSDQVLLNRRFWLSTHRDVHDTARLKAVREWVKSLCTQNSSRLMPY